MDNDDNNNNNNPSESSLFPIIHDTFTPSGINPSMCDACPHNDASPADVVVINSRRTDGGPTRLCQKCHHDLFLLPRKHQRHEKKKSDDDDDDDGEKEIDSDDDSDVAFVDYTIWRYQADLSTHAMQKEYE
eukprot:CAMPEP_0202454762 /NCGR_PEP_ID=MMETSP1360-20130828/12418_1 /ASSEMBLY_ACC=CAM_ASM_000848 /TAXON_ID=515479 /ORGANISM="Licmophora paradoxa, Strain CCMP2313" /LENGTH=130 /DNA_ID=CAMNT_0049074165 /DNA_START=191 /DNA_END=583 /DNA_ORIENTATION=+